MAKDGTNRGGARPGAGRKPKSVAEKIKAGQIASKLSTPADIKAVDMPPIKDFLTEMQRDGTELCAKQVYEETYRWLVQMNCESFVSQQLLEMYSMAVARFIQCESAVSKLGLIAKHPTTGAPISSPYVKMAQDYNKQATILGNEINQIVKDNAERETVNNPTEDVMEVLLRTRRS